jgi:hypothetical protein
MTTTKITIRVPIKAFSTVAQLEQYREAASGLLQHELDNVLGLCPRCSSIFVKPRKQARYCSRKCQNTHCMQLWRDTQTLNPEVPSCL